MRYSTLFFALLAVILAALACEKKKEITPSGPTGPDPNPNVTTRDCNVLNLEVNGENVYSFRFDAKNRLDGAELIYPKGTALYVKRTFSLEYNNDDQLVRVVNDNFDSLNKQVNSLITIYEYDNAKKLTSINTNEDPSTRRRLSFNTDQKLLKIEYPNGNSLEYEYDNKGNVTRHYQKFADQPYRNIRIDYSKYDDKKNPFAGLGVAVLLMGFNPYSVNNPLTVTIGGLDGAKLNTINFTYTYSDKGYPATSNSVNISVFAGVKAITENGTYQYVCK
jgi:YD repeat-containing protein